MKCPFCGGEMRAGVLTYRGGFRQSVLAADAGLEAYRERRCPIPMTPTRRSSSGVCFSTRRR